MLLKMKFEESLKDVCPGSHSIAWEWAVLKMFYFTQTLEGLGHFGFTFDSLLQHAPLHTVIVSASFTVYPNTRYFFSYTLTDLH